MKHTTIILTVLIGLSVADIVAQPVRPFIGHNRTGSAALSSTVARIGGSAAYPSVSDGLRNNPALLTHRSLKRGVSVSLAQVAVGLGGDLVQFGSYESTFASGRVLDAAAVDAAMDDWFGPSLADQRGLDASLRMMPISVTWVGRDMAIAGFVRGRVFTTATLSRGWADLILTGTGSSQTYPLDGSAVSMGFAEFGLAVSRRFDRLQVGISPRLLAGAGAVRADVRSTLTASSEIWSHEYVIEVEGSGPFGDAIRDQDDSNFGFDFPFGSGSGSGFGLDIGASWEFSPRITFGASITDIGSVSYDGTARRADRTGDPFEFEGLEFDLDRLDNEFGGELDEYASTVFDELFDEGYDTEPVATSFSIGLPTTLNLAASWQHRIAHLHGGISASLYSPIDGYDRGTTISVGALRAFGPLRLEGGLRVGGRRALQAGFGLRLALGGYEFGLAALASPETTFAGRGGSVGVGLSLINLQF